MSYEFVDLTFPLASYLLRTRHPGVVKHLFPPDVQNACPKPVLELHVGDGGRAVLPIWWPALLPLTLLGIVIGLYGHAELQAAARKRRQALATSWSLSMAFYACMNIAAMGCHCLVARSSPWQAPLVAMDVAATGCCCFSALYGAASDELSEGNSGAGDGGGSGRSGQAAAVADASGNALWSTPQRKKGRKGRMKDLLLGNGLINISAFYGSQIPFMYELLYIVMAIIAAVVVGRYVVRRPKVGRQRLWIKTMFFGAAVALSGMSLDRHLCRAFGAHVNHVMLLFAGCHVIMVGLMLYVREELLVAQYDKKVEGGGAAETASAAQKGGVAGTAKSTSVNGATTAGLKARKQVK